MLVMFAVVNESLGPLVDSPASESGLRCTFHGWKWTGKEGAKQNGKVGTFVAGEMYVYCVG